jgi:hypothetical protein
MPVILSLLAAAAAEAAPILALLVVVLVGAMLAGELMERVGQPAVLGELLVGIVLGNLTLLGGRASITSRGPRPSPYSASSEPCCCSSRSASSRHRAR